MSIAAVAIGLLPTIWIVDASNGPGANFVDLPAAIAAAQSGDTLLVRPGLYTAFRLNGKSLTIRGSGLTSTRITRAGAQVPWVEVGPAPAGGIVTLAGMSIEPVTMSLAATPALQVLSGAVVVLTDSSITGAPIGVNGASAQPDGAMVAGTLHAARCTFTGGSSVGVPALCGDGVQVNNFASFAADDCRILGGTGSTNFGASFGGHGLLIFAGTAALSHTSCLGGSASTLHGGTSVPGIGLAVLTGGFARTTGTAVDRCAPGLSTLGSAVGIVTDATSTVAVHGTVAVLSHSGNVTFDTALPRVQVIGISLPSGETDGLRPVTVRLDGPPNALFALLVDTLPEFAAVPVPNVVGELLVPFTAPAVFSVLGPFGTFQLGFVPATTIPQVLGTPLFLQAGAFDGVRILTSSREMRIFSL